MNQLAAIPDEDFPWLGQPRVFTAVAMPREPAVQVIERRGEVWCKFRLYSLGEARALRDQLDDARAVFDLLGTLAPIGCPSNPCGSLREAGFAEGGGGRPTAYTGPWPIRDHGTIEENDAAAVSAVESAPRGRPTSRSGAVGRDVIS